MKKTRDDIMGMPIVVEITDVDAYVDEQCFEQVFDYLVHVDETFSTYKKESEVSRINRGDVSQNEYSSEMKTVFALSEETKRLTNGYFDIRKADGSYDPSGLVKGWAIYNAANILLKRGCTNFCVDVAGDIQTNGKNAEGEEWTVGIRNPFHRDEIVKVVYPHGKGVATSGTYIRGDHIYNPRTNKAVETDIVSMTVIGPNVYEADRFATGAFAMGHDGLGFLEELGGFEAYAINTKGIAVMTSRFEQYTTNTTNTKKNI